MSDKNTKETKNKNATNILDSESDSESDQEMKLSINKEFAKEYR